MLLDGIFVPLTTPFYRDGRLYVRKLEHNVDRFSKTPAAGMIALGPGSEASALSDEETREVLHAVAATAAKEKVLIAGVSRESVRGSLAVAEAAAEGFDAVLAGVPACCERNADEARTYFGALADASPLPVILFSGHGLAALPVDWVAELARHSNVIGMIDERLTVERYEELSSATAGVSREVTVTQVFAAVTARMLAVESTGAATFVSAETLGSGSAVAVAPPPPVLKTRTKVVGFPVLAGGAVEMVPLLAVGVAGAAPALAACAPQACYEVYAAWKDGDPKLSAEKAERISSATRLLQEELGVAGLKYACDLNGYYGGAPRLPRLPLDGAGRARADEAMKEIRN
ncbi:MAG TPA: dihydrodipicolinate synthase family protein [Acidobacteriaceae bacterium]|nr:dihydrodipicolinate synthase family protein [Acidobacteriaceae bacterium]